MSDIPPKPKVREDLVIVEREEGGRRFTVIKDPLSGRFFSVGEDEAAVLRLLDGSRTPREVLASLPAGPDLDEEDVGDFVRLLDGNAMLVSSAAPPAPGPWAAERSVLALRLKVLDPKGVVDVLARRVGFLVSLPSLVASLAVVLCAAVLLARHGPAVEAGAAALWRPSTILVFYAVLAVMMTVHELAHAVACRRLGGEVREMGVMLMALVPCVYTDVSDIYLMKKRSHRMAVIAAGPLSELTLWGLVTIGYFLVPGGGMASSVLCVAMLTSGLRSLLMNVNPLLKFDGYYLLEEVLGVSNLMERSRRRLLDRVRRPGKSGGDGGEGRLLLVYGALSFVYTVGLSMMSAVWLARGLKPWLGGAAYGVSAALVAAVIAVFFLGGRGEGLKKRKFEV
jgi:putative peptide zinc metalloprotease protein